MTLFRLGLVWVMTGVGTGLATAQTVTNQAGLRVSGLASNLPVVFLDAKQAIVSDPKVPCTLRLECPVGSARGATSLLAGVVRIHGASSQGYPKKSYSVTLDAPARLLDLRTNSHWVLNAAYIDRSLMRHKLSYDLFRSLSSKDGPRFAVASRFVEVYLNGRYNGVYLLMERVDRQLLGLRPFRSNEVSHACIYKAIDHAANFAQRGHAGYEQREPDPLSRPFWQPLDELNRFVSSAPEAEFFHDQTGIGSRLDLDNAIDFHLLILLISNSDGITKNYFIARDAEVPGQPRPRFFFAPWDADGTFGRNWDASPYPASAWLSNHLFERLLGHAPYREKFAARWTQLRAREFSAAGIRAMIDSNARELGAAAGRNAGRWPTAGGPYPDRLDFLEDLAQMRSWVEARIRWLDEEITGRFGRRPP